MYAGCQRSSRRDASSSSPELDRLHEPLAARDDLERSLASLVELHRVPHGLRLSDERAGLAKQRGDPTLRACFVAFPASSDMAAFAFSGSRERQPGLAEPAPGRSSRSGRSRPRVGRPSSRHHVTSVTSPNVHTIAMPVPFSGSASSCATTGTGASKSGVYDGRADERRRIARPRGWRRAPRTRGSARGETFSISTVPPPSRSNAIRW